MKAPMRPEYMKGIVSCVAKNGTVTCGITPFYCSAELVAHLNSIDEDGCTYFLTYPTSKVKVLGVVHLPHHYDSSVIRAEQAATERRHRLATKRRVERERQEARHIHLGSEMHNNPFAALGKVA